MFFRQKKDEKLEQRKQELLIRIKPILLKELEVGQDKIIPTATLVEDLGADSLDSIELTMALEEEFNIEIPDEEANKMKTIEDMLVYLAKRLNQL